MALDKRLNGKTQHMGLRWPEGDGQAQRGGPDPRLE